MVEISVVIPTYNRRDTLETVLPSLSAQDYPKDKYELILVDNGSADGTDELIEKLAIPNLKYCVQENSGRSGARNRGIREASGSLILFTDADIIASPNLISSHAEFISRRGPCAIVGCEIQVDDLDEYEKVKSGRQKRRTLHKNSKKRLPWYFFLTGNAVAPKQTLIDVGMFDENFTGYGHEDIELGYRIERSGLPIFYNPDSINYHWHPVSFQEKCEKMRLAGISTVRFFNKYKDNAIKFRLGYTPLSMLFYGSLSLEGTLIRLCEKFKDSNSLCSDIILQKHYVEGIKEGENVLGR